MIKSMTASALSNDISAILKRHDFNKDAPGPDVEGARVELTALFGASRAHKIDRLLDAAAATFLAGFSSSIGFPNNVAAHDAMCNAWNDLTGSVDEQMMMVTNLVDRGYSMEEIASEWGWQPERLTRFWNGDRDAVNGPYFYR